jgi:hypothetical protein
MAIPVVEFRDKTYNRLLPENEVLQRTNFYKINLYENYQKNQFGPIERQGISLLLLWPEFQEYWSENRPRLSLI